VLLKLIEFMSEGSSSMAGFFLQDILAAIEILNLLYQKSDIEYIQLDNFKKGPHIDDVIVVRKKLLNSIR
jgi:hypothetical protein